MNFIWKKIVDAILNLTWDDLVSEKTRLIVVSQFMTLLYFTNQQFFVYISRMTKFGRKWW